MKKQWKRVREGRREKGKKGKRKKRIEGSQE